MIILNCHKEPFVHLIIKKHEKDHNYRMFYSDDATDKFPMLKDRQQYLENISGSWLSSYLFEKWAAATDFQRKTNKYLNAAYKDEPYVLFIGDPEEGDTEVKYLRGRAYKTICTDMKRFFFGLLDNDKSYSLEDVSILDVYRKIRSQYKFRKPLWDKWSENHESYYRLIY